MLSFRERERERERALPLYFSTQYTLLCCTAMFQWYCIAWRLWRVRKITEALRRYFLVRGGGLIHRFSSVPIEFDHF